MADASLRRLEAGSRCRLCSETVHESVCMLANRIHPRAVLTGDIEFGAGNVVESGAVLVGPLTVGDGNFFGPNCVVGGPPQDDAVANELRREGLTAGSSGGLTIGDRNVVREFATIHRGLTGRTIVGDDCYLMAYSHIPHDCVVGDRVKLANSVQMGGYTWLGRGVYLGLSAVLHQFTVIGAYSMIGMGSVVTMREVPPGSLLHGSPARIVRPNAIGLEGAGVTEHGWWSDLIAGSLDVTMPQELEGDLIAFRSAVNEARVAEAAVAAWRAERRRD